MVSRNTKVPPLVKNPWHVSHLRIHFYKADIWRSMKGHTLERNHFYAKHVLRHLNTAKVWRSTKGPTQERSHFHTLNVERHLNNVVVSKSYLNANTGDEPFPCEICGRLLNTAEVWRSMKWLTQERRPLHALNVERDLNKAVVSRNRLPWLLMKLLTITRLPWLLMKLLTITRLP